MDPGQHTAESPSRSAAGAVPGPLERLQALCAAGRWAEAQTLCRSLLEREPGHPIALSLLGVMLAQSGRTRQAAELLGRAAAAMPDNADAHTNHGNVLRALQRREEALACYERALALSPDSATAQYNRGLAQSDLGRYDAAILSYRRAVALRPDYAAAWSNLAGLLHELGRHEEALAGIERAVDLQPGLAPGHYNRGVILHELGRLAESLASFEGALALEPKHADAHVHRGAVLAKLRRYEEALASLDRALALRPGDAGAHLHRGDALRELERLEEALASYDRAVALQPRNAEAHAHRGAALTSMRRYPEALASLERALALDPRCLNAHVNRGVALRELKRPREALGSLDEAIRLDPSDARPHHYRGIVLGELGAVEEAVASLRQALAIDPRTRGLRGDYRYARMQIADWEDYDSDRAALSAAIERGEAAATPFVVLSLFDSPPLQRRAAEIRVREQLSRAAPAGAPRHPRHERIRVGYFSPDLRDHAVARLTAGLFEAHDRSRFEITAFSVGPDASDGLRQRLRRAFDRFLQLDARTDGEIAALARELEIDIAVDLGGYTRDARPGILALRAAPIQVSYLGYLGTLGAQFMDYLLADSVLVPAEARAHYSEKIAYLPSYQVNDTGRTVAERVFSRAELGLPPSGFVFCCFNNTYKITPETFASWMRILSATPGSVLLLLGSSPAAERNLRRQALRAGVAPERLVFGSSLPVPQYLARYRSADLFLDTWPYNAGTTASDALWAGLPVLTLPGQSFAARMAASLLTAAGLPELIAADRADYERRAVELAADRQRLEALERKLAGGRDRCALFDTATFTRALESLYRQMYQRRCSGLPPAHLFANEPVATQD